MKKIALVCKLMPLYRLGVFHELSKVKEGYTFTCFGDTKKQAGIENIPWTLANNIHSGGVNWVKTSNYFYIPERLLWQTGIIKRIFNPQYKYFIFEGAIAHVPTWIFAILCRIMGKKVLFWTHGFLGMDKGIKKIVRTIYFRLANALLLYGNYAKELMIQSGFDEKKLFVIYNSLNTQKQLDVLGQCTLSKIFREKAKIFDLPDAFTLIFIGRLLKEKGIASILNAIKVLYDRGVPINGIFIGQGPEMETIQSFIAQNNLEGNIHTTGSIYQEEVICKYFSMSDLMISPGNVGLNCIHSLTYGVPVLTHDNLKFQNPEVEAIIPGQSGLLFKHNDFEDMLAKILQWRNAPRSKEEIKVSCLKVINTRYNPINHANKIINAIDNI